MIDSASYAPTPDEVVGATYKERVELTEAFGMPPLPTTPQERWLGGRPGLAEWRRFQRRVRYWAYRHQAGKPDGLGDAAVERALGEIEEQPFFHPLGGWAGFADRWDINIFCVLVPRKSSVLAEWNSEVARSAKPLPVPTAEGVVEA